MTDLMTELAAKLTTTEIGRLASKLCSAGGHFSHMSQVYAEASMLPHISLSMDEEFWAKRNQQVKISEEMYGLMTDVDAIGDARNWRENGTLTY